MTMTTNKQHIEKCIDTKIADKKILIHSQMVGTVRVGQKRRRGVAGDTNPVVPGFLNIDATSGSANKINGYPAKEAFSPMYLGPFLYEGELVNVFENWWQYSKMFDELGHIGPDGLPTQKWFEFRKKGWAKMKGDRHPVGTRTNDVMFVDDSGKNRYRYMKASCQAADKEGKAIMGYVSSRKYLYSHVYCELVKLQPGFHELKKMVDSGMNVQILDVDGPREEKSVVITKEELRRRIEDTSSPMGHGFFLAAMLLGIEREEYI